MNYLNLISGYVNPLFCLLFKSLKSSISVNTSFSPDNIILTEKAVYRNKNMKAIIVKHRPGHDPYN